MPTPEDYARELIGQQAMRIISLRSQLDAAHARTQDLEKQLFEAKALAPAAPPKGKPEPREREFPRDTAAPDKEPVS